jgi:hypothetical protein
MKRGTLFYFSCISYIVGCPIIGYGVGILFDKVWASIFIGLGIGLIGAAIISSKAYKRLLIFNKEEL